jgi:hypothetical protein
METRYVKGVNYIQDKQSKYGPFITMRFNIPDMIEFLKSQLAESNNGELKVDMFRRKDSDGQHNMRVDMYYLTKMKERRDAIEKGELPETTSYTKPDNLVPVSSANTTKEAPKPSDMSKNTTQFYDISDDIPF